MAKSSCKYTIVIRFSKENPSALVLGRRHVPYKSSNGRTDDFYFNKQSVRIVANRWERYRDSKEELYGNYNSLNQQIQKAVLMYYASSTIFPRISYIKIKRQCRNIKYEYVHAGEYEQPLETKRNRLNRALPVAAIEPLLNEDNKGEQYRACLSYWLKANAEDGDFIVFSNLWRCFNALYRFKSGKSSDSKGLMCISNLIQVQNANLPLSIALVAPLTLSDLKKYRWIELIHGKLERDKENENRRGIAIGSGTKNLLTSYHDSRIIELADWLVTSVGFILRDLTTLKENDSVTSQDVFIRNYIANCKLHPQVLNYEILALLITAYGYFLRNTLFHGVVGESSFKLGKTKENIELTSISELMFVFIKELFDNNLL